MRDHGEFDEIAASLAERARPVILSGADKGYEALADMSEPRGYEMGGDMLQEFVRSNLRDAGEDEAD